MKEYDGKVRVVFKNMVVHPQVVMDAHKAGCAAGKQQKFIAYKDAFWEKAFLPYASARDPSKLGKDNIMAIAKDIGLDTAKLEADMNGEDCNKQIQDDMQELQKFHVNATAGADSTAWARRPASAPARQQTGASHRPGRRAEHDTPRQAAPSRHPIRQVSHSAHHPR